jgi:lipopolysaccharide/colanic/teichoic acid biosynthesis glycosyltransferase
VQHVLVVGLSHLTELFLRSVAEYASKTIDVVGILSTERELHGHSLRFQKVLGAPEELSRIIDRLEVHGITPDRVVVMQSFDELSREARDALFAVERGSGIQVDWLVERLGFTDPRGQIAGPPSPGLNATATMNAPDVVHVSIRPNSALKRTFDVVASLVLLVLLAPMMVVIGLVVAVDVGFPIVFWQKRPGRSGRPFKLFKFCTMRASHNPMGNRIPDECRSSIVGRLLRRTRLDELPQLYNILIGEMSFVGPRPLLSCDQPAETMFRLSVRPGLTGLAQVHGERTMSPDDKNTLDVWYVRNASLWLDLRILLRTVIVFVRGERVDHQTLQAARDGLERLKAPNAAQRDAVRAA